MTLKQNKLDVTLEITRQCPLSCLFCSSNGGAKHPDELDLTDWINLVDDSIELGARSFLISGGEPFASPYLQELAEYISQNDVKLSIYSSGNVGTEVVTPVPKSDLEYIARLGNVRMVMSLEGANQKTHEKITGVKGSYNNTIKTIKECLKLGLEVEFHFVPTKINFRELLGVVELANQLGVSRVSVLRLVAQGRCVNYKNDLELNIEERFELKSVFGEVEKYGDYVRIGSPFNPFLLSKQYKCTAGTDRITITYNGLVSPCEAFKYILNEYLDEIDIRKHKLSEIWNKSSLFMEIRELQNISAYTDSICYNCKDLEICGGGCPAQKILHSSITSFDPYCKKYLDLKKQRLEINHVRA